MCALVLNEAQILTWIPTDFLYFDLAFIEVLQHTKANTKGQNMALELFNTGKHKKLTIFIPNVHTYIQ